MKIFRLILSLLVLFVGVAAAAYTVIMFQDPRLSTLVINVKRLVPAEIANFLPMMLMDVQVSAMWLLGGVAAFLITLAGLIWPPRVFGEMQLKKRVRELERKNQKTDRGLKLDAAPTDAPAAPATGKKKLPTFRAKQLQKGMDGQEGVATPESVSTAVMRELINKEQQTIDRQIATEIIEKSYPGLSPIIPKFYDEQSLVSFSRQIIAILRIKAKLDDTNLSSYQFSQFQEKVYQMEEEKLLHQLEPVDSSVIPDDCKSMIGQIFDIKSYRQVQQDLRAGRDDWTARSVKDLLPK